MALILKKIIIRLKLTFMLNKTASYRKADNEGVISDPKGSIWAELFIGIFCGIGFEYTLRCLKDFLQLLPQ